MQRKSHLDRGNVFQNIGWSIIGSILRLLVQLILGIVSARYLGPQNYGILNYVGAYINLFSIVCELGLTITIVNEIIASKESEGTLIGTAIFMRFIAGIIAMLSLLLITRFVDGNDPVIKGVAMIRSVGLIFDSVNTINYWYQAQLQSKYTALYELVAYIMSSIYKVIILIQHKDIFWFAAATTVDSLFIAIFYLIGFRQHSSCKLKFSFREGKRLLKIGIPFIFSGIMVYVYGQTDRIMIGQLLTQTDVGYYSCASSIGTIIGFIPQAIMNSGKPVIMEAHKNVQKYELRLRQTISAVLWVMIIYSVVILLLGYYVVLLLYGKEYLPALNTLKILVWSYGLSYVGTIRNIWLVCEKKRKYATIFSTFGAIANIGLNFQFIPIWGINGAAIATVFTQVITTFLAPFCFKKTRRFSILLMQALFFRGIEIKKLKTTLISIIKRGM